MSRFAIAVAVSALAAASAAAEVPKPAALIADGVPAVPDELAAATPPYMEYRTAGFSGWNTAENKGHGFAKKENVDYQFWSTVQFWNKSLLGQ